jgi:hypothetical protein
MSDQKRTKAAMAHVAHRRQQDDRSATWMDVAEAYDMGLRHGLSQPRHAIKQIEEAGYVVHDIAKRWVERRYAVESSQGKSGEQQ